MFASSTSGATLHIKIRPIGNATHLGSAHSYLRLIGTDGNAAWFIVDSLGEEKPAVLQDYYLVETGNSSVTIRTRGNALRLGAHLHSHATETFTVIIMVSVWPSW